MEDALVEKRSATGFRAKKEWASSFSKGTEERSKGRTSPGGEIRHGNSDFNLLLNDQRTEKNLRSCRGLKRGDLFCVYFEGLF